MSRPEIRQHFLAGSPSLKVAGGGQSMHGSYLFISVPLPNHDASAGARAAEEVESCAAFASLLHGEFVATERHFAATYDLQTGTCSQSSPGIYIRQTAEQEVLNQGLAVILDRSDDSQLEYNATALSLLRRSHHERDATLKFLFLWLALESVLGNGRQRRHFALEVMESESLNEIINRLRARRDALLHDGLLIGLDQKDYLRIKCVLIIGLSQSHELRKSLLAYLEGALND